MVPIEAILSRAEARLQKTAQPLVTLSYAQSLDGSIAMQRGQALALSGAEALKFTHQLRSAHAAILVGIGTVLADNPRLTVRLVEGPQPQPVVLDSHLRTPLSANLLDHPNGLWIATGSYPDPERQAALESAGARILHLPLGEDGNLDMLLLLECLRANGIRRVMVEGGARVITAFLQQGLADLLFLTIAPLFVGGYHALQSGALRAHGQKRLVQPGYEILGEDLIVWGELS